MIERQGRRITGFRLHDRPITRDTFLRMIQGDLSEHEDVAQRNMRLLTIGDFYEKNRAYFKVRQGHGRPTAWQVQFGKGHRPGVKEGPWMDRPSTALTANLARNQQDVEAFVKDPPLKDQDKNAGIFTPNKEVQTMSPLTDQFGRPIAGRQ